MVAAVEVSNGKAIAVKCDVGVEADILNLFKQADGFGKLGVLVNNAGVVDKTARVDEMSAERLARRRPERRGWKLTRRSAAGSGPRLEQRRRPLLPP